MAVPDNYDLKPAIVKSEKRATMENQLLSFDLDALNKLYKEQEQELQNAILNGAPEHEVTLRRNQLNELSSVLHMKLEREGLHSSKFPPAAPKPI